MSGWAKTLSQSGVVLDFAHDVAEDPAEIGSHAPQRPVGALELFGQWA